MKRKLFTLLAIVMFLIGTVCSVNATLFVRGTADTGGAQQLIYDDVLDITWFDYTCGPQNWSNAMFWANSMSLTFEGTVYDDWRLPITTCTGEGPCEEGEPWHLFHNEGVTAASPAPFYHVQPSYYWTGTLHDVYTDVARCFSFINGNYANGPITTVNVFPAIAVRDGDVAAPIPEPTTALLLGTGLIGMVGVTRRKIKVITHEKI